MAHFAKLGIDNVVLQVVVVDTIDCMTRGGIEREEIGVAKLVEKHGHETWKQCSYNSRGGVYYDPETNEPTSKPAFRANYPGDGWYYSSEWDIFYPPKTVPYESWTLNTTTGVWEAPLPEPNDIPEEEKALKFYMWDEDLYQSDNTQGWVVTSYFDEEE